MRFIYAAREFSLEHGTGLRTIALFTEPDRHAMFVREADEAVSLGAAQTVDPGTGQVKSSYVDYARLKRALVEARADAVWAGWGFVAGHAALADLCSELDITFIGPDGDAMRRLGDRISGKRLAEQAQIAVPAWSGGPVETLADACRHAERLGYPLLIKATAGGGGHSIRRVNTAGELQRAFESARAEAFRAFGDPTVFMEQLVNRARHIEVQIVADDYGTTWAVGVRDCTIQRRHRKILEESPSPALSPDQDAALREAAVRLSRIAGYRNAGTVEFLYDPELRRLLFMKMNTGLQMEHPVTECTTGLDLVKLQIHIARGGRLAGEQPRAAGHAIEVRLTAEDPDNGFAPAPVTIPRTLPGALPVTPPATLEQFRILAGPGVRIDTGAAEGDTIAAEFDPTIAKIIACGQNRNEALARLRRVLHESVVVIRGGVSNKAFLLDLLDRPEVQSGDVDIEWLDRLAAGGAHLSQRYGEVALVQAAIEAYGAELAVEQAQFYASAARGRPHARSEVGRTVDLRYRGQSYSLRVCRTGPQRYRVETDGAPMDFNLERLGRFEYWLSDLSGSLSGNLSGNLGRRFRIISAPQGQSYRIEVDGVSHRIDRDDGGVVQADAPAVVVSIAVKPGDTVAVGDPLVVLEAMKMELQVVAPFSGRIRQVMTIPYSQVDAGTPLVQIEPIADDEEAPAAAERVVFGWLPGSGQDGEAGHLRCRRELEESRQLLMGFDVDPKSIASRPADWPAGESEEIRQAEDEILNIFVDTCSLFGRQQEVEELVGAQPPCAENHLFAYLRMLDTRGEGLPPAFVDALRRALAHYGVRTLDRTPELEESLLWIYKSHQRVGQQSAPILGVLGRRLERVAAIGDRSKMAPYQAGFRTLLDRLIAAAGGLFPAVSDLARELRFRCFDQPLLEHARQQVYAQVEDHLAYLAAQPQAADRNARIRALIECPQPLVGLFSGRFRAADGGLRELMLEVLTSRYYRLRKLMSFHSVTVDSRCYVSADYDHEGKRIHIFTSHVEFSRLAEAATAMRPLLEAVPAGHDIAIDFYAWHSDWLVGQEPRGDEEAAERAVRSMLNQAGFPRPVRRIVVAVAGPCFAGQTASGQGMAGLQHFTYRHGANGYEEEKLYRGIHPMMAKRLQLWRLENFNIDRLPSAEDVYLFHGVARDNPKDERLFGCAEIRDLTPVRDESGRIVHLPHLERMLTETLAGMRLFQSRRRPQERLYWNRVLLYVWPPLDLQPEELHEVVRKLAPETDGLGLEQVVVRVRIPNPETGELRDMVMRISRPGGTDLLMTVRPVTRLQPLKPLADYTQKVVRMRQRGLLYPYEIIRMLTPALENTRAEFPQGTFTEYDLDAEGVLATVDRPHGQNTANIIVGLISNFTAKYPEGMKRVVLLGDPSKEMGAIAEPECRRILAALNLAKDLAVPLEWFAISAGAKISMDSGVENMDWVALVLRRLIEFTQGGGEVNVVVDGINVGAQPYWNAEATMLMHTRGILVMTQRAAMVLTGKRALDYSGSVSAEDNSGIGGYDRIMGVNGQAQYWARDIDEACHILLRHYEHTYVAPGERFPRRATTADPMERNVELYPHSNHGEGGFARVGEIFSDQTNPGRKKSFDVRRVMLAVVDQDHAPLERWPGMGAANTAVVWDAHLGGYPVCLIGIESRPVPRLGFVPADGPDHWSAGTLFPRSSKKIARAVNAASNNRPVVVLANLSGFDGSPESMRKLQLEYGAEIGRAVVNFRGPIVFCVISRYHGGAYVVFSRALNENVEVVALEGSFASVIGGAPAAAVVFSGEVAARTRKDPRLLALQQAMPAAEGVEKIRWRAQSDELFKIVHSEKLGEMADEFDHVHSVHRALKVGALDGIIPPASLRPYLIEAVERGIRRVESGQGKAPKTTAAGAE